MNRQDFSYHLPESLIARHPTAERTGSRLMVLEGETGQTHHHQFSQLLDHLHAGDVLVINDTRVIPARVYGQKTTGGQVEMLVERITGEFQCVVHLKASKSPKPGSVILFDGQHSVTVMGRENDLFIVESHSESIADLLSDLGHMPLPPYLEREDTEQDRERYQTVYNNQPGAVAAPTAGLHFDEPLLTAIKDKGVEIATVTLHVGSGTFQPVRTDNIQDHAMHSEWLNVSAETCQTINNARRAGGRIIAVGTTSVRSLETAAKHSGGGQADVNVLEPFQGETDIFIYPGYEFQIVDAMVTNFHLSESTLLMLVAAFAGYQKTLSAYSVAVDQAYRFFSYGDAMFITKNPHVAEDMPPSASQPEAS